MNSFHDAPSWILSFLFLVPFLVVSYTGVHCGQFLDGKYGTSFIIPTSRYITKLHGEIPRRKFHANVLRSLLGGEICLPWQCQYRGCQCCCNENKSISWCTDGSPSSSQRGIWQRIHRFENEDQRPRTFRFYGGFRIDYRIDHAASSGDFGNTWRAEPIVISSSRRGNGIKSHSRIDRWFFWCRRCFV